MSAPVAIPPHLRKYVVEQDYAAYTARDQAVWRFVVGHAHRRLCASAHPAYAAGFRAAGISTERIPNLHEMSAQLESESGFRVVCVDGFIPPRAFQAFQARGMLPVAADIRSAAHLTYTPAPDIIHEAAGHAPFLAEASYARFLRRIGAVSEQAFESSHDRALYQVIYRLSELKESPDSTPAQIAEAEAELALLRAAPGVASEATRMARLYWWTVEYGLIGSLADYRLYGAGLLSSIGEAHFCHDPKVHKLPLSAASSDVDYDITQAQPQLFVTPDFASLEHILSQVEQTLSHVRGGQAALDGALGSGDVATFKLDSGLQIVGTLQAYDAGMLRLAGPCMLAEDFAGLPEYAALRAPEYVLPLGALEQGTPLSQLTRAEIERSVRGGQLVLRTRAGLCITGVLERQHEQHGRVRALVLRGLRIVRREEVLLEIQGSTTMALAERVVSATPLLPDGYHTATAFPSVSVPKLRSIGTSERSLIEMHELLATLRADAAPASLAQLEALHASLRADYPDEWLLRLNLLEVAVALGSGESQLAARLEHELEQLEQHFEGREPIATGLASLRAQRG
jgi:phenylalanine-4-hydroxylase